MISHPAVLPKHDPMDQLASRSSARSGAVSVAVFAGLSVALAAAAAVAGVPPMMLPFVLALGPTAIALIIAWHEGHGALGRLLRTAITRPDRRMWYGVVALPVLWALATVGMAVALGQPTIGIFDKVFPGIVFIPLLVLLPAFAEEIAWRGFAIPRLMGSMSPLIASVALAVPWVAIHLPLLLPGQMNEGLAVWPTVVSLVSYSVLLTWLFVRTGGSVLLTALVHTGLNGVAPLMGGLDVDGAWAIRAILAAAVAIAIIGLGGFRPAVRGSGTARAR